MKAKLKAQKEAITKYKNNQSYRISTERTKHLECPYTLTAELSEEPSAPAPEAVLAEGAGQKMRQESWY